MKGNLMEFLHWSKKKWSITMNYLYVAAFGALGAAARYLIGIATVNVVGSAVFPYGTLAVNLLGSFLLAFTGTYLLTRPYLSDELVRCFGTGFIGAFTTFSTFSVETVQLLMVKEYFAAGSYVLLSMIGGISAAALGLFVGNKLSGRNVDGQSGSQGWSDRSGQFGNQGRFNESDQAGKQGRFDESGQSDKQGWSDVSNHSGGQNGGKQNDE
jgi:CrcB protein